MRNLSGVFTNQIVEELNEIRKRYGLEHFEFICGFKDGSISNHGRSSIAARSVFVMFLSRGIHRLFDRQTTE